jgi:transcriptional regulator with XRE-family HTH domain
VETIGKRIEERLKARGMNKAELARATGLSESSISRIVSGARPDPGINTISVIARALDYSVDTLCGRLSEESFASVVLIADPATSPERADNRIGHIPVPPGGGARSSRTPTSWRGTRWRSSRRWGMEWWGDCETRGTWRGNGYSCRRCSLPSRSRARPSHCT